MPNAAQLLSPHFTLGEFTHSQTAVRLGLRNEPGPAELHNLYRVAALLEQVRALCGGQAVLISSGYRSAKVNKAVGGARQSLHSQGRAVDFTAPGFGTPLQVCRVIRDSALDFDELIFEGAWVHLGITSMQVPAVGGRRNVLTAHFERGQEAFYSTGLQA